MEAPKLTPNEVLKQYWGFDTFRPLQLDIINAVLEGRDTLALLPTGGGKSICFQVPAICTGKICIVISPLIALMKDQVENLRKRGIQAHAIYAGMHYKEIDRTLDNCVYGKVQFLYVSPERLETPLAIERIKKMNVGLIAVDESHCISQWGYDFRPAYLNIAQLRDLKPNVPVIALTATATAPVVKDIQEKLVFKTNKQVFQKSYERSNLAYVVLYEENKQAKMLEILRKVNGSAVVYVLNRRATKEIAHFLQRKGISADYYHAGRTNEERSRIQEQWIKNKKRVMVATNAFGMGIDKPDVRVVIHLTLSDSLEAYFQEAGRGGRDGEKAFAILLYNQSDRLQLERKYKISYPTFEQIRRIYQGVGNYFQLAVGSAKGESFDFDISAFSKVYDFNPLEVLSALKILEKEELLVLSEKVYIASQLQMLVGKEQLYDYILKHPKLERLLKVILRSFQGAMQTPVQIKESEIARFLRIRPVVLTDQFVKMDKDGVLAYTPSKDSPQLTYIQERMAPKNLKFDKERYSFLKKRHAFRMQKVLFYAETLQCRNKLLLDYFDEKEAGACGQCDVCQNRHKAYSTDSTFYTIRMKVEYFLRQKASSIHDLVPEFKTFEEKKVLKAISHLIDNGVVARHDNGLLTWEG